MLSLNVFPLGILVAPSDCHSLRRSNVGHCERHWEELPDGGCSNPTIPSGDVAIT